MRGESHLKKKTKFRNLFWDHLYKQKIIFCRTCRLSKNYIDSLVIKNVMDRALIPVSRCS